jgi:hypothetical protein
MKSFKIPLLVLLILLLSLLTGCGAEPTPTPDAVATQIAVEKAAHATMTAEAPTTTNTPTDTATPTSTNTSTSTPMDTPSPSPTETWTPSPTPTHTPTMTPSMTPTSTATQKPKPKPTNTPVPDLLVTYRDFHYECAGNTEWTQGRPPYQTVTGYRRFQTLMVITNQTKDRTLESPWMPDRWIVTDGTAEWEETYAWQWGYWEWGQVKTWNQPPIGPGATARWTWMCFSLPKGAWVKAAEFTAWDHTYRFEFPKPNYGDFNYYDCP